MLYYYQYDVFGRVVMSFQDEKYLKITQQVSYTQCTIIALKHVKHARLNEE